MLAKADEKVSQIQSLYNRGLLSNAEREKEVIAVWDRTTKEVTDALMNGPVSYTHLDVYKRQI